MRRLIGAKKYLIKVYNVLITNGTMKLGNSVKAAASAYCRIAIIKKSI